MEISSILAVRPPTTHSSSRLPNSASLAPRFCRFARHHHDGPQSPDRSREGPVAAGEAARETSAPESEGDEAQSASDSAFDADRAPFDDRALGYAGSVPLAVHGLVEVVRGEAHSFIANAEYQRADASAVVIPFPAASLPASEAASASALEPHVENLEDVEGAGNVETGPAGELIAESIDEPVAPDNSLLIIRLALVAFMATGWFLSRTFDTPIYLVLGLATAAIGLHPSAEPRDHRRWISVTLAVEVLLIIFVYLVVRLRH